MKLLLVEDEERLVEALTYLLKKNGYLVDAAQDGETGVEMAATGVYDIIILDRMLPYLDGISLLREIRSMGLDTPVLFLTAKDSPKDKVEGLDAGADDYLVKPFFNDELLARLRALCRRKGKDLQGDTVDAAGLVFDPLRCEVTKGDEVIHLTLKESLLLELLIRNYGRVITKERIMEKIWGYNSDTEMANINLYIHYLRKKLKVSSIKTVRGVGYFLQEDKNVPTIASTAYSS
ncbi:MAG TPA: response regulator transcription factor [Selenomonadales bacterium]|nr:response regulator transcription factor [Selenomonadales bacterium]